jgi:hypothetical protein
MEAEKTCRGIALQKSKIYILTIKNLNGKLRLIWFLFGKMPLT